MQAEDRMDAEVQCRREEKMEREMHRARKEEGKRERESEKWRSRGWCVYVSISRFAVLLQQRNERGNTRRRENERKKHFTPVMSRLHTRVLQL